METTLPPVDVVHAILDTLAASGGNMEYVDLLNALPRYTNLNYYLRLAISEGYTSGDLSVGSRLRLTDKGWATLYERALLSHQRFVDQADKQQRQTEERRRETVRLEERREDHARQEHQDRTQNRLAYLNLAVAVIIFILGLIVDHYTEILSLLGL